MLGVSATAISAVISGVLMLFIKRYFKGHGDEEKRRECAKKKETELILRSLNALGRLTVANSIALRDGKSNGELSSALDEYARVEKEMYAYLISTHTQAV